MRRQDWAARLADYLTLPHRFDWVENNCAFFTSGAVLAVTGEDYSTPYRGPTTRKGMVAKFKRLGGVAAVMAPFPSVPVLMAQRGDVAEVTGPNGVKLLGVVVGAKVAVLAIEGVIHYEVATANRAWRV